VTVQLSVIELMMIWFAIRREHDRDTAGVGDLEGAGKAGTGNRERGPQASEARLGKADRQVLRDRGAGDGKTDDAGTAPAAPAPVEDTEAQLEAGKLGPFGSHHPAAECPDGNRAGHAEPERRRRYGS